MKADIAIAIVITPQSVLSGALSVMDILTTANLLARRGGATELRFRPRLVSVGGGPVQGSSGIVLPAQGDLPEPAAVDAAIICASPPAVLAAGNIGAVLEQQQELTDWLRAVHGAGGTLLSCCTGAFMLAATGLLDGRLATTHWHYEAAFRRLFPQVELRIDSLMVEEERIVTGGGALSFPSTILWLIQRYMGEAVANSTAKQMLAESRVSGQNAFRQWLPQRDHGDEAIAQAQGWLEEHYREVFDLEQLAERVHLTPRTLMRRFKQAAGVAPLQYQQGLRVQAAKDKLEATQEGINQIVWQVGYEDVSSFQRLFKRETGLSMTEYRQRFGGKRYDMRSTQPARPAH